MEIFFKNFIANEQIKAALTAAFLKDRLPQAIILQGEDGVGKKTLAQIIANIAVCKSENKPCGICPACVRVMAGSHPDIRVESGSGVSGNISVDSVRKIIDDAQKKPEEADLNIYLLHVKNKLMPATQNKLLKIMEEPPGRALFIITINSVETLLPTIRSRSVCYTLLSPPIEQSARFVSEKNDISYSDAIDLAKLHGGNIGAMLGGKDVVGEKAVKIVEFFDSNDEDELLSITYPLIKDRVSFALTLEQIRSIFRDAVLYNVSHGKEFNPIGISEEQSIRLSNRYRRSALTRIIELCTEFIELSKKNLNMNLLVTTFCAKIREQILK